MDSICPDTIQLADRFHQLMNRSDALDTFLKSISAKISKLIKAKTCKMFRDAEAVSGQDSVSKKEVAEIPAPVQKPDSRQEVFNMVKKLQAQGLSKRIIGRELDISRNTVTLYFLQDILVPKLHPF